MSQTLGDVFAAYLKAQADVALDQAKLAEDQDHLAHATATFTNDLTTSGVEALLAPQANTDGSTPVAIANSDGSFSMIVAAAPTTPVPRPSPTPDSTPSSGN